MKLPKEISREIFNHLSVPVVFRTEHPRSLEHPEAWWRIEIGAGEHKELPHGYFRAEYLDGKPCTAGFTTNSGRAKGHGVTDPKQCDRKGNPKAGRVRRGH